ncbi:MAG: hypothetical protein NTX64_05670 [Elusimicrobia bacterium]|nr:hypothetical protein [Elusimicrobiota bacterium]
MRTLIAALVAVFLSLPLSADDNTLKQDVNVKVCEAKPIKVTLAASPISVEPGNSSTLSWTVDRQLASLTLTGAGSVQGQTSAVVTPAGLGAHVYTLSAADDCNNTGSASVTVTVRNLRVFLSGSMYCWGDTVKDWLDWTTSGMDANLRGACEGYTGGNCSRARSLDGASYAGVQEFVAAMKSWPRDAEVYSQAHVGGTTDVVDENGDIVGTFQTASLLANGIPGFSWQGNPFAGQNYPQPFFSNGTLTINNMQYEVVGFQSFSPIVLDLSGDGKPDVDRGEWLPHPTRFDRSRAILFDITATGFPSYTEWIGPKDGLLVAPLNPGETITGGQNLFGNPIGFLDGYQKLGLRLDKDENGAIEGKELDGLMVWQDLNSNGRAEPGELKSVQELGITQIRTRHEKLKSTFVMNGQTRATWDWWPTSMIVYPQPVARASAPDQGKL